VRTGSNYMPTAKAGMGGIFGQVMREGGTTSMSGDEMDDFLEARAAFVETGMGGDEGSASMNCLKDDFADVFEVFIDVLRNPAFAEDKIELAKVQANTGISRRNDNVGAIVGREFRRLVYGTDSPLAAMAEYDTVASVTQDDLLAWHKKYYHPNNIYIGVSGDFDSKQIKPVIEAALKGWSKGPAFNEPEVAFKKDLKPGVYYIEKDDVTQANIRAGHLGIKHDNPDYFAVEVMNDVMGNGFSGRLMQNIRSEKGLAYSVFGGVGASLPRLGVFQVGMSTKSETMAESTQALRDEVAKMISEPATEEELIKAKQGILNSFVFNYTSRAQILAQQMTYSFYGLPADYLDKYKSNIEKVTAADVARVAEKYMHPDKMVVLVVGKSADYDQPVASLGEAREIDITIPPPPDTRPELAKNAATMEAGNALVARMSAKVTNGVDEPVHSTQSSMKMVISMGGQSMALGQEITWSLPDKIRQTVKTPMGEQIVVLNGDQGVVKMGGQNQPLPAERVTESLESLGRDLLVLASHVTDIEAVAAGSEDVDGTSCDVVSVTFRGSESRLCIDSEGQVLQQSYQGKHPFQGTPGLVVMRFTDWTEYGGRLAPSKHVMSFEGEQLAEITVDSLTINPELDASLFEVTE